MGVVKTTQRTSGPRAFNQHTGSQGDATSTIFNMSDCRVSTCPTSGRRILNESTYPPGIQASPAA